MGVPVPPGTGWAVVSPLHLGPEGFPPRRLDEAVRDGGDLLGFTPRLGEPFDLPFQGPPLLVLEERTRAKSRGGAPGFA